MVGRRQKTTILTGENTECQIFSTKSLPSSPQSLTITIEIDLPQISSLSHNIRLWPPLTISAECLRRVFSIKQAP